MRRTPIATLLAWAAMAGLLNAPAHAQFGGFIDAIKKQQPQATPSPAATGSDGCEEGKSKSVGSSILGALAGQAADRVQRETGEIGYAVIPEVKDQLTNEIACRLQPVEQKQAAEATVAATRGDDDGQVEIGSSAEWTSSSRKNVSGRSTVTGRDKVAKGKGKNSDCITVTDVIIVEGEETTAEKRMCRPPGSRRYSLLA